MRRRDDDNDSAGYEIKRRDQIIPLSSHPSGVHFRSLPTISESSVTRRICTSVNGARLLKLRSFVHFTEQEKLRGYNIRAVCFIDLRFPQSCGCYGESGGQIQVSSSYMNILIYDD